MNVLLLAPLLIAQINAGSPPEAMAKHLRINAFGIQRGMGELPAVRRFPISRYLRLATHLQSMPERERVTWLRMAARSQELDEPAVLLARMLIRSKNEKQLRTIYAYVGQHSAGKPNDKFPDSPIEIHLGVPFCVATSAGGTGFPEDAATYVEYLLSNGEWRPTVFKVLPNDRIAEIANEYLMSLEREGFHVSRGFRDEILAQASVPLEPTPSVP